jgi:N-formylglutamate amidohydrolase
MRRDRWKCWTVALCALLVQAAHAEPNKGESKESFTPLVFVQKGVIPLVITSPHGGREAIPDVPKRVGGEGLYRFVASPDENTGELTDLLAEELERLLGRKPYVVRAKFSRRYCDVNREPKDAYESPGAKLQYDYYHKAIADACREVLEKWHAGLFLDIHGQSTYPDKLIRGTNNGRTVTMLTERRGAEAYMGQSSLLGRMAQRGYEVLPSIDTTEKEPERYAGGHTVKTYGSHQTGGIDAIQFEFGRQYRVPMSEAEKSARDLAEAIVEYAHDYLPAALPEAAPAGR